MKKRIIVALAALAVSAATIIAFSSFTSSEWNSADAEIGAQTHTSCEGKHCNYTVGCNCPGFSPITNGNEWQKSMCRHCGHHKSYHK